jgi:hypothetical protein
VHYVPASLWAEAGRHSNHEYVQAVLFALMLDSVHPKGMAGVHWAHGKRPAARSPWDALVLLIVELILMTIVMDVPAE